MASFLPWHLPKVKAFTTVRLKKIFSSFLIVYKFSINFHLKKFSFKHCKFSSPPNVVNVLLLPEGRFNMKLFHTEPDWLLPKKFGLGLKNKVPNFKFCHQTCVSLKAARFLQEKNVQFSIIQGTWSETVFGKTQQTWEVEDILLQGGGKNVVSQLQGKLRASWANLRWLNSYCGRFELQVHKSVITALSESTQAG